MLELWIEYNLAMRSDRDLVEWAVHELASAGALADDPGVIQLAGLVGTETDQARSVLARICARACPSMSLLSPEAERLAQRGLWRVCIRYLAGDIEPYELCRVVSPIEDVYNFPSWLGDLYNTCDWVGPSTRRAEVPHLAEEAANRKRELEVLLKYTAE